MLRASQSFTVVGTESGHGKITPTPLQSRYFQSYSFINRREHARPLPCGENFLRSQVIRTILPIISFCVVNINMNLGGYYC